MAFPWAAVAQGGAGILGNVIAGAFAQKTNREQREWNEKMYWAGENLEQAKWEQQNRYNEATWQKQNEYNEMMWHKMNAYNSPMAQMERFKEAGLNPFLIYGQSNTAPAIATAQFGRSQIGEGKLHSWNPQAPYQNLDLTKGISAYFAFREQAARTNNLEKQNKLIEAEVLNKVAETLGKDIENKYAPTIKELAIESAKSSIQKTETETAIALRRDEREAAKNSSDIREAAQRILNMRGQQINQQLEAELKRLDLELKRNGIQPTDNIFLRILGRILADYGVNVPAESSNMMYNFGEEFKK